GREHIELFCVDDGCFVGCECVRLEHLFETLESAAPHKAKFITKPVVEHDVSCAYCGYCEVPVRWILKIGTEIKSVPVKIFLAECFIIGQLQQRGIRRFLISKND